jgi:hypothetical protein
VEFALAALLAISAVWFTLQPILHPAAVARPDRSEGGGDGDDQEEDMSPRAVALRALKEIEFDRATGKLSDTDYDALKRQYTGLALQALRDAASGMRDATSARPVAHPASPISHPACPAHGLRPEPDAEFCSECGRRLRDAPGYCAHCGTELALDARYCNACGARVAA